MGKGFFQLAAQSTDGLSQISAGLKSLVYNKNKSDTVHIGKVSIADIIGGQPDFTNYVFYKVGGIIELVFSLYLCTWHFYF